MYRKDIEPLLINSTITIKEVISSINRHGCGIALLVNEKKQLIGTITDGDIRRAILSGLGIQTFASVLIEHKTTSPYPKPITALQGTDPNVLLALMRKHAVRQVPLLDSDGCVVDLVLMDDLLPGDALPVQAVIMAGGYGTRLRPLTDDTPKPLLPVGDHPLMELIISQLRQSGVRRIHVTTHYLADRVKEHFGRGDALGVDIQYTDEENPLGTAGALGLIPHPDEPLLVINGDILTKLNFRAMLKFHQKQRAELTVAVRQYSYQVPYGVLECDGPRVIGLQEKPTYNFFVNAGIYIVQPTALELIPRERRFDMTDLIQALVDKGQTVACFPIVEYWLDIGQTTDYEQAQKDFRDGKFSPGDKRQNPE